MSQALASAKKRALVAPSSRFGGPIPSASAVTGNTAFANKINSSSQPNNLSSVQSRIGGGPQPGAYNPNIFAQQPPTPTQQFLPPQPARPMTTPPVTGVGANIGGQSVPQIFSVLDSRLSTLEMTVKDIGIRGVTQAAIPEGLENIPSNVGEILEEYGSRFDIIADELASLKNTLISLQKYTMEVNKILFEERMLSGETRQVHFEEAIETQDTPVLDISAVGLDEAVVADA